VASGLPPRLMMPCDDVDCPLPMPISGPPKRKSGEQVLDQLSRIAAISFMRLDGAQPAVPQGARPATAKTMR